MRGVYNFPDGENKPKTARHWAEQGFLVKDGITGEEMRSNRLGGTAIYFFSTEVYQASEQEISAFWDSERRKKNERAKEKRRIQRERIEKEMQPLAQFLAEHKDRTDELTIAVCKDIRIAMRKYRQCSSCPLYACLEYETLQSTLPKKNIIQSDAIVIDTETTGLSPLDGAEILQLSIINQDGETLFNEYFKPMYAKSWNAAMEINHITPEMVANKSHFYEHLPEIQAILQGAKRVIGYNTSFDLAMLHASGAIIAIFDEAEIIDVMQDFAPIYGEWHEAFGSYKWQKLTACAAYYDYDWGKDAAHDSLADCRATLYCYQKMHELPFDDFEI